MSKMNNKFSQIGFDDFRGFASDDTMSKYEKIGFPDTYRKGYETFIFEDIKFKLPNLLKENQNILDIGPGCSELPEMVINLCRLHKHTLNLIDSSEMLDLLPNDDFIIKKNAMFPNCTEFIVENTEKLDVILCYSVLQYILIETSFLKFLDASLSLLAEGGQMLLGDIPNISKRKRFFASQNGVRFHQKFMNTMEKPTLEYNVLESEQIDDSIVMAIILRARLQGFDAYVLPQNNSLPMSNRREDILIIRP